MTDAIRRLVVELGHPNYKPTTDALEFAAAWCRQYQQDPADRVEELARVFDAGLREREQQLRDAREAWKQARMSDIAGGGFVAVSFPEDAFFQLRAALGEGAKG